jgi:2-polyprenyl-3-methyl-5-hydroxy-6-metoxy-1,4-benzoquinol methylase
VFRDVPPERFRQIHREAFKDSEYIETATAFTGGEPSTGLWSALDLPGASVLEIGPGAGHLLAAAQKDGRQVAAVESSAVHRDFIRETWGIDAVYPALDDLPAGREFDAIMAINVFEHVYDIEGFLRSVRAVLAPGGTFFVSTPNGASLEASVLKAWWSMCKVHDHVSFPSPAGMTAAARASGLRVERIWSASLPFEFPVSALTAGRDRLVARRAAAAGTGLAPAADPAARARAGTFSNSVKAGMGRFYSLAAPFDPTARLLSALGRAGSVKARLTR